MKLAKYSVLTSIAFIIKSHEAFYSYTSQKKYLELLAEHHSVTIGIRQLNYHLADLEKEGLLERIKRNYRAENGEIHRRTSAICITMKGWLLLGKKGVSWAYNWLNKLRKKYLPQAAAASTQKTEITEIQALPACDSLKKRANEAIRTGIPLYERMLAESRKPRQD